MWDKCEAKRQLKKIIPDRVPLDAFGSCLLRLGTCMCLSACPSQCSLCWHGCFHYTVTVHQSPAPRQPCRLATRVWFTEGRLHPGAKGRENRREKKGPDISRTSSFPPSGFHRHVFTMLQHTCLCSLHIWLLFSKPTAWYCKHINNSLRLYSETHMTPSQAMSQCHLSWCSIPPCQLLNVAAVARYGTTCTLIHSVSPHHMHMQSSY